MDGKDRLRRYLEQRRELGESEFVLDGMSIDEALQAVGAIRRNKPQRPVAPQAARQVISEQPARDIAITQISAPQTLAKPSSSPAPKVEAVVESTTSPIVASASKVPSKTTSNTHDAPKIVAEGTPIHSSGANLFKHNPFSHLDSIAAITAEIEKCKRCPLYETATNAVPGEGNIHADFMCVGEAPGANEDATGRPFIGAAGQLLTKILAAVEIQRDDVFICNVLKHRPPGNRNPTPSEVEACSPYLIRQIEIIRPKVILALGTFAAQTLLGTKTPIGKLRGTVHSFHGVPLVVTYHPAALLRNPAWKRPTWEDVKLARRILDDAK